MAHFTMYVREARYFGKVDETFALFMENKYLTILFEKNRAH